MKIELDAIYEDGVFRPVVPPTTIIADGQKVRITVDNEGLPPALQLLRSIYDGLSEAEIDEIEQITLQRGQFFGSKVIDDDSDDAH